eukprot:scaffold54982_cov20-Prasinocladus_malaysianus.AAC.1
MTMLHARTRTLTSRYYAWVLDEWHFSGSPSQAWVSILDQRYKKSTPHQQKAHSARLHNRGLKITDCLLLSHRVFTLYDDLVDT